MSVILDDDNYDVLNVEAKPFKVVKIPDEGKSKLKTLQFLDKGNSNKSSISGANTINILRKNIYFLRKSKYFPRSFLKSF